MEKHDKSGLRYLKYLGRFHMLTDEGFFETSLFKSPLTKFLPVCNFGNTLATTIIFFWKRLMFDVDSRNETKKSKKFFIFKVIAFELGVINTHNLEQDTYHR